MYSVKLLRLTGKVLCYVGECTHIGKQLTTLGCKKILFATKRALVSRLLLSDKRLEAMDSNCGNRLISSTTTRKGTTVKAVHNGKKVETWGIRN